MNLMLKKTDECRKRMDFFVKNGHLVWRPFRHNEVLAGRANEQRQRANVHALRSLIRARTSELLERSPKVRKFSHSAETEAIA